MLVPILTAKKSHWLEIQYAIDDTIVLTPPSEQPSPDCLSRIWKVSPTSAPDHFVHSITPMTQSNNFWEVQTHTLFSNTCLDCLNLCPLIASFQLASSYQSFNQLSYSALQTSTTLTYSSVSN